MLRFSIQCAMFPYAAEMKVKKKKRGIKGTLIYLSLYDVCCVRKCLSGAASYLLSQASAKISLRGAYSKRVGNFDRTAIM